MRREEKERTKERGKTEKRPRWGRNKEKRGGKQHPPLTRRVPMHVNPSFSMPGDKKHLSSYQLFDERGTRVLALLAHFDRLARRIRHGHRHLAVQTPKHSAKRNEPNGSRVKTRDWFTAGPSPTRAWTRLSLLFVFSFASPSRLVRFSETFFKSVRGLAKRVCTRHSRCVAEWASASQRVGLCFCCSSFSFFSFFCFRSRFLSPCECGERNFVARCDDGTVL